MNRTILIGAGGVGSWLAPQISRQAAHLVLIDGDTLEPKNLERQLYDASDVGKPKAEALRDRLLQGGAAQVEAIPEYLTRGSFDFRRSDVVLCAVDNHAARRAVLDACDRRGCSAIFGANETTDAEAYVYERAWQGTPADPRVRFDLSSDAGDPTAPAGCTGAVADEQPQLVTANAMAASLMASLYQYHFSHRRRGDFPQATWPIAHTTSFTRAHTLRFGDLVPAITNQ